MRADLDRLMRERGIGAVIVPMHEAIDPSFRWLTRGAKVTRGYAVKVPGDDTLLLHYPMERDEAAASGVMTRSVHEFGHHEIFQRSASAPAAYGEFFDRVFRELEVEGSVAFYGRVPVHIYFPLLEEVVRRGWSLYRSSEDLIQLARKTKDDWELQQIASVGERTELVVDAVRDRLRHARIVDDHLHHNGRVLTLGDLKHLVTAEIHRLGMIEDHETILSQGRDAAIPHSRGDAAAPVRIASPIVLDIFPADRHSGYFFDLTRTFAIGASDRLVRIHADVLEAFETAASQMKAGTRASDYQKLVCDLFEAKGYATTRSDPKTNEGYVHSLGHGVGLEVHEKPSFSLLEANHDLVEISDVLTIEPGLYFPDEELGVRIEDTFRIDHSGRAVSFSISDRGLAP